MRKQDIEIRISPSGEVSFTIKGVKGASCIQETKFLEHALGGAVIEREHTTEFYDGSNAGYAYAHVGEEDSDEG